METDANRVAALCEALDRVKTDPSVKMRELVFRLLCTLGRGDITVEDCMEGFEKAGY